MNSKAFTILELIMVILILGIIAAVVMSSMQVPSELRLEAAKNKIMHDIRYAQNLSVAQQRQYGVRFSPIENRYWLYDVAAGLNVRITDPVTGKNYEVNFNNDSRYQNVTITILPPWINGRILYFDKWGRPYDVFGSMATEGRIGLTDTISGKVVNIYIYVNTGLVSITSSGS